MTWAGEPEPERELEPELVGEYLIAPGLEPELVLFYSGSPVQAISRLNSKTKKGKVEMEPKLCLRDIFK